MPPLTPNGPDLPAELLQEHEEGRLIFFCGAGVSFASGLPGFKDLVRQTYEELGREKDATETEAFRSKAYDRVFELLERRVAWQQVRGVVREVLTAPRTAPFEAHRDLLQLAQNREGQYRLITTNFDDLFERAAEDLKLSLRQHVAPAVPARPWEWSGLVHLHGALADESSLVLSSSDFGRAYLTEGWASRFLRDLFREYAVLFVGYGLNDPIVRYLTDALASQRKRGEAFRGSWILAGVRGGAQGEVDRRRWSDLGVVPCFYNQRHRHTLLYRTLSTWARLHRGGLHSRATLAASKLLTPPDSAREDDARMVVWALSDATGTAARVWLEAWQRQCESGGLSEEDARTALKWLDLFESSEELKPHSLLSLPVGASPLEVHLAGLAQPPPDLPAPTRILARWLAMLVAADPFLRWLVKKGTLLHPYFAEQIREQVSQRSDLDDWKRTFLLVISSPSYQDAKRQGFRLERWIESLPPMVERLEASRLLRVIPSFRLQSEYEAARGSEGTTPPLQTDLRFCGHEVDVGILLDSLRRPDSLPALASHAGSLTTLLEDAVEWLSHLYPERSEHYRAWSSLRSIAEDTDGPSSRTDWTILIRLLGSAIGGLSETESQPARALLSRWRAHPHPIFQRLVLHAVTENRRLEPTVAVNLLLQDDCFALWQLYYRPERERFLRLAGDRLSPKALRRLEDAILIGPPEIDSETDPNIDVDRARSRAVWRLLSKLQLSGAQISRTACERLARAEARYGWRLTPDHRDELLSHSVELDEQAPLHELLERNLSSLADFVCGEEQPVPLVDSWDEFVQRRPSRALLALRRCAARGAWPPDRWGAFLNRAAFVSEEGKLAHRLTFLTWLTLEQAPEDLYSRIIHSLTWNLRAVARLLSDPSTDGFYRAWDRTWKHACQQPDSLLGEVDSFDQAINHPAGHLAEALVRRLIASKPEKDSELPSELGMRFEIILGADHPQGGRFHAQLILAAHLPFLFFVDRSWTVTHILPLFDWSDPRALHAWNAFLHRPRFSPDLLDHLKSHLITTVLRRGKFDSGISTHIVELIAILGVEAPTWVQLNQQRALIRDLNPEEFPALARPLGRFLQGESSEDSQRWRELVKPWFVSIWPKETRMRSQEESNALAEVLLESGDAFPDALASVGPFLMRVPDSRVPWLLHERKESLVASFPAEVLRLLDLLVPDQRSDDRQWAFFKLGEVLERIRVEAPALGEDHRYRRLREVALT